MSDYFASAVVSAGGSGIPEGRYRAKFIGVEHLKQSDGDPATGKGRRDYETLQWSWEITVGPMAGKTIKADCGPSVQSGSRCVQIVESLAGGKTIKPGEPLNPMSCVGREYICQYGPRTKKSGRVWTEVLTLMSVDA